MFSIFQSKIVTEIKLVPYNEQGKPVVYGGKVYQLCFSDIDGDCILKDDITGVKIISRAFSGDDEYDQKLMETYEEHPFNKVKQIECNGKIIGGITLKLQSMIDALCHKKE